jgi:predicted Zn-dependent peptidase
MGTEPVSTQELEASQHFLVDSMPIRWESVESLALQLSQLHVLQLPDNHYDVVREKMRWLTINEVSSVAHGIYRRDRAVVVVAGDPKVIARDLTQFGPVTVVDPSNGFRLRDQFPSRSTQ